MKKFFIILQITLLSFWIWAADDFKPEDFAGTFVYSGKAGSLLLLEIPEELYHGIRRPDLGDIRIFDASDNPVPFNMRTHPAEIFTPDPANVQFFNWNGGNENNFPVNTDIEINTHGGVVKIKNQNNLKESNSVFLVDLSSLKYIPSKLKISTANNGRSFNTPVSIHYSDDLTDWSSFDKKQILASFGGNVQDTLELPDSSYMRYLLISYGREAPKPLSMKALFGPQEKPWKYHEARFAGKKSSDGKKINYNTGSYYPIESIDFVLSETDSIPVIIRSRHSENDDWEIEDRETIYRYNTSGGIEKNDPFETRSRSPYWELEASGGLSHNSIPEMVIRWKLREIIFLARGQGPWTLAYGKADCPPLQGGSLSIAAGTETESALFTGEKRYTETAMPAAEKQFNRQYLLWAFLAAAVIILTILAFNIAKTMRR